MIQIYAQYYTFKSFHSKIDFFYTHLQWINNNKQQEQV